MEVTKELNFTQFYAGKALSSNVYLTAANFVLVFVLTILT
jgi:hypothetical protein